MADINEMLTRNLLEVFGNRNEESRLASMRQIYTDDFAFIDHDGTYVGYDAVNKRAIELLGRDPEDFVFTPDGVRYSDVGIGALAWTWGPIGEPVVRGMDVITLRGEKIDSVHTLLAESSLKPKD